MNAASEVSKNDGIYGFTVFTENYHHIRDSVVWLLKI